MAFNQPFWRWHTTQPPLITSSTWTPRNPAVEDCLRPCPSHRSTTPSHYLSFSSKNTIEDKIVTRITNEIWQTASKVLISVARASTEALLELITDSEFSSWVIQDYKSLMSRISEYCISISAPCKTLRTNVLLVRSHLCGCVAKRVETGNSSSIPVPYWATLKT